MAAMSQAQKDAMAQGRREARAVRNYLEALERGKKRGPKDTPEKLTDRIAATEEDIAGEGNPQAKLELIQQRMDLEERLETLQEQPQVEDLEAAFVEIAASYSERKGISYAAWKELGVKPAVLREAGVKRGG